MKRKIVVFLISIGLLFSSAVFAESADFDKIFNEICEANGFIKVNGKEGHYFEDTKTIYLYYNKKEKDKFVIIAKMGFSADRLRCAISLFETFLSYTGISNSDIAILEEIITKWIDFELPKGKHEVGGFKIDYEKKGKLFIIHANKKTK